MHLIIFDEAVPKRPSNFQTFRTVLFGDGANVMNYKPDMRPNLQGTEAIPESEFSVRFLKKTGFTIPFSPKVCERFSTPDI